MYADFEEARAQREGRRSSRGSDVAIEKSARSSHEDQGPRSREKELAEQLRKRAQASRSGAHHDDASRGRKRSPSVSSRSSRASSPARSNGRSPTRSRSRSRDTAYSRRSHHYRKSGSRADEEAEERRKRRRGEDAYRRDRNRDRADDEDEERARERRRRRSDRRDDPAAGSDSYRASPAPSSSRADRDRYDSYYDDRRYDRAGDRGHSRRGSRYDDDHRRPPPRRRGRYGSPTVSVRSRRSPSPEIDDYEERSVFCSQLSARLGQRDLGEFFEDHLGEGAVQDVRIVMDRATHRSKGVGYVEFAARELVPKAIELTGKILFGIPIVVQRTDAARNGTSYGTGEAGSRSGAQHPAVAATQLDPRVLANAPLPMQYHTAGAPIHLNVGGPAPRAPRPGPGMPNTEARLYVGSLHFSLTDADVKAVFEPFGEIEYVDLHREPGTGKSKGFCFIQFKRPEDAKNAREQMNGFVLADRAIRVGNVNAKGSGGGSSSYTNGSSHDSQGGGHLPQLTSAFDDGGGAGLNPERRAALMEKLARNNEPSPTISETTSVAQERPAGIPESTSTSLLLKNMFDPAEETEPDWDKDLAEDVKDECQAKYGPVTSIHVEKDSAGEIYVTFANLDASRKALDGLNGRFFGGKPISAQYIPDAFVQAKLG